MHTLAHSPGIPNQASSGQLNDVVVLSNVHAWPAAMQGIEGTALELRQCLL